MIESVLNNREKVAEMPIFVMKLRRFIGRKGSDLNIDNKFFLYTHFQGYLLTLTGAIQIDAVKIFRPLRAMSLKLRAKAHCAIIFITPALMPGL